jgi:hypothetical protein
MALTLAQWGDADYRLASAILRGERDAAQRDGWFPAMMPSFAGETLPWLERSPFMPHATP